MLKTESILRIHLNQLRRRWPLAVATALIAAIVATAFAFGLPDLYRSSAYLLVDHAPDPVTAPATATPELSGRLQAIREEVLSREQALALAEEFDLYPEQRKAGMSDAVASMLQRDIKVEPASAPRSDGRLTTVSFRLSYTGTDPQKVAAVTNRLAQAYVRQNGAMREGHASRAVAALKRELDAARGQLAAQQGRVREFTAANAGSLPAQLTAITTRHAQLTHQLESNSTEIAQAMERRDGLQNALAVLSTGGAGADVSDPVVRLAMATRELAALSLRLTDASVEVRNKRMEIAGLQSQVAALSGTNAPAPSDGNGAPAEVSMSSTVRSQIAGWTKRIDTLQKKNNEIQLEIARHDGIIARVPMRSADLERINGDVAPARTQYEAVLARYQSALAAARAQRGETPAEFRVVDPARPAESPSAPNRELLLGLALLLAVALGWGAVMVAENLDQTFRSVDELRAFTTVPVLAVIPDIVERDPDPRPTSEVALVVAAATAGLAVVGVTAFHVAKQAELVTRMLLR